MPRRTTTKCLCCGDLFEADARNRGRPVNDNPMSILGATMLSAGEIRSLVVCMNYDGSAPPAGGKRDGIEQPVVNWTPSIGISAIAFYNGDAFPHWRHNLFVASLRARQLLRLVLDGRQVIVQEVILRDVGRIRDVRSGPEGYLYLLLQDAGPKEGRLVRLVPVHDAPWQKSS